MSFKDLVTGFGDTRDAASRQACAMLKEEWPHLEAHVYRYETYDTACVSGDWSVTLRIPMAKYNEYERK